MSATIEVEPIDLTRAANACTKGRDRVDASLAHAARSALFSPDPGDAAYRDRWALESLAWELERDQLCREADALLAVAS